MTELDQVRHDKNVEKIRYIPLSSVATTKEFGMPNLKEKNDQEINQRMATYSLLLGILVIIISWKIFKDWASGIAGFIYGGILFWSINLFVQIIKALFK